MSTVVARLACFLTEGLVWSGWQHLPPMVEDDAHSLGEFLAIRREVVVGAAEVEAFLRNL